MKLQTARVTHYKSIEDSEAFPIDALTCLVGKNESGKTAILQALTKLNPALPAHADFDELREYPRRHLGAYRKRMKAGERPAIVTATRWMLEPRDLAAVAERFLGVNILTSNEVEVFRGYSNRRTYRFQHDARPLVEELLRRAGVPGSDATGGLGSLLALQRFAQENGGQYPQLTSLLQQHFSGLAPERQEADFLLEALEGLLPRFAYFCQYHLLPGRVAVNDLLKRKANPELLEDSDRVFLAFLALAGTSLEELAQIDDEETLVANVEGVANRISEEVFRYWSQNPDLQIKFSLDAAKPKDPAPFNAGRVFNTRIENRRHGVSTPLDDRSAGFLWFFSFLVWFSQIRRAMGSNLVLLLDEPGHHLHARAQRDLLRFLREQVIPEVQVIYTTHSPFLVDEAHWHSLRWIEDIDAQTEGGVSGTRAASHIEDADSETLYPLQAALGHAVVEGLLESRQVLLVESARDRLYLAWMAHVLARMGRTALDPRLAVVPAGDLARLAAFTHLFAARGASLTIFTSIPAHEHRWLDQLHGAGTLPPERIITTDSIAGFPHATVEDLFGAEFYVQLVNAAYDLVPPRALQTPSGDGSRMPVVAWAQAELTRRAPNVGGEFSPVTVAQYLLDHSEAFASRVPPPALDAFDQLFGRLNAGTAS